jgi:hypothetical protein
MTMDGSAFRGLGAAIDGMIGWAIFGMVCAFLLTLGAIGFVIWFVVNHVQIV